MAVYAVGDIQGCFDELRMALDAVRFDPAVDRLWFVGDLVNRGPKSLETLRFVYSLGNAAISVLGNHDLHLLAIASGNLKKAGKDTLGEILDAPDREELLHWLRHCPLIHHDRHLDFALLHAGLPPQWRIEDAVSYAREVESVLQSSDHIEYFDEMYGNKPKSWSEAHQGMQRYRFITNCFTRLRFCTADGVLALKEKGPPGTQAKPEALPWFEHPHRASRDTRIVFGHWSTLGYLAKHNVWAIDSGCLWGGALTMLRIDTAEPAAIHLPCEGAHDPNQFA
jgi:bis(5'-nucleosyl)-tetraphosphatase (symmetrical)